MAIQPYEEQLAAPVVESLPFNVMPHQAVPAVVPFAQQQLVQVDGRWLLANVPPAPPVIITAPTTGRRGLSRNERAALIIVGSVCAVTLSVGAAIAMAGPYLAEVAHAAIGAAIFVGASTAAWFALRLVGPLNKASRSAAGEQHAPIHVTNHVTVHNEGFLTRGNATGVGRIG